MSDHPKCNSKAVFDPPQTVYEDYYHPQHVDVIHQIQVIRRHHCVPCYHHKTSVSVKTYIAATSKALTAAKAASLRPTGETNAGKPAQIAGLPDRLRLRGRAGSFIRSVQRPG